MEDKIIETIPITYIVKTQRLYVDIFSYEDGNADDFSLCEISAKRRAYDEYLEKMFYNDIETKKEYDRLLNSLIIQPYGTYKEICDFIRSKGYRVLSLDNSSKKEIKQDEKTHLHIWREWKYKKELEK